MGGKESTASNGASLEPQGFNDESVGRESSHGQHSTASQGASPTQLNFEEVGEEKQQSNAEINQEQISGNVTRRKMPVGKHPRRDDPVEEQQPERKAAKQQKKPEDANEEQPPAERKPQKKARRASTVDAEADDAEEPGTVKKPKRVSLGEQEADDLEEQGPGAERKTPGIPGKLGSVADQDADEPEERVPGADRENGGKRAAMAEQEADEGDEQVPGTVQKTRKRASTAEQDADDNEEQTPGIERKPRGGRRGSIDDNDKLAAKEGEIKKLKQDLSQTRDKLNTAEKKLKASRTQLRKSLVQTAKAEREKESILVARESSRIGRYRQCSIAGLQGSWEGGTEAEEIQQRKSRLRQERSQIEQLREKLFKQSCKKPRAKGVTVDKEDENNANGEELDNDMQEEREVCNHRVAYLSREETSVKEQEAKLRVDRTNLQKLETRLTAEETSNYSNYPLIGHNGSDSQRYQLLNLLGKGQSDGSEVFKAFDLEEMKMVAVKIYEFAKNMTDPQRSAYVKREEQKHKLHKELQHPRLVTLFDGFGISNDAFATVLELCDGDTLDAYMKKHGPLPEKDARGIVIQILSGLKYMNGRKIVHDDLKPGNLFFKCGEVKIMLCDPGSSKKVVDNQNNPEAIHLMSPGTGTACLHYLPPECFEGDPQPDSSSKADVWSTGVIFFELLYNRKPFGHNQPEGALMRSAAIGTAFEIEIPQSSKVSQEARDFLKRFLNPNRDLRPDILEAFNDPYLKKKS